MKNVIVTIGEILLGAALFLLIVGGNDSLKSEATRIFTDGINTLKTIKP